MATSGTEASSAAAVTDRDYPLSRVPRSARQGTLAIAVVIAGFFFYTPTMVTGGEVAGAFSFGDFLGLAAVATVVLGAYIALMGLVSERTGLTTALVTRLVLGRAGGKWGSFILGGTQLGWYGVSLGVLAELIGGPDWLIMTIGGVLMASTAYFGFKGIEILSWISVPLMLVLCVWVTSRSVGEAGGWGDLLAGAGDEAGTLGAGTAITMMIATFISGGTQIGNWTRFSAGAAKTFVLTLGAVLVIQFAMLFFGGVGVAAFGAGDFVDVLMAMGIAGLAVFLLLANLWTTNDNTAYAFAVAGSEFFGKPDKRPFVVGGVVVSIVLALTGIADNLVSFLSLLGVVIPPLGGAIIGTFFLVWRGKDPGTDLAEVPWINVPGLTAYLAGAAVALAMTFANVGSPAIVGIVVAALVAPLADAVRRRVAARG